MSDQQNVKSPRPEDAAGDDDHIRIPASMRPFLKLTGVAAGVGSFLLFFGFLSQSAMYGYAGLPMLSMDPVAMIEVGASALVDSLGLTLGNITRVMLLLVTFSTLLVLALFRDAPGVRRITHSAGWCMAVHLVLLLALATLLSSLVDVAQHAAPGRRSDMSRRAESALAAIQVDEGDLRPSSAQRAIWRTTYEIGTLSPWLVLNRLAARAAARDAEAPDAITYGRPLRPSSDARRGAEEVYGWLMLSTFVLILLGIVVSEWRAWLEASLVSPQPGGSALPTGNHGDGADASPFPGDAVILRATRHFLAPSLLGIGVLVVALVPIANGVLAQGAIGHEQVIVRLKPRNECLARAPKMSASREAPADPAGGAETDAADQSATRSECSKSASETFEEAVFDYSQALIALVQQRRNPEQRSKALRGYRKATDALFDNAFGSGCDETVQLAWLLRPHPALFDQFPDAAQYFWDGWTQRENSSRLRFGYILQYPRGAEQATLAIFDTLQDAHPLHGGRWIVQQIPRECIESMVVVPELVRASLDAARRRVQIDPESEEFKTFGTYMQPATLQSIVTMLERNELSGQKRLVAVTWLGTLTGVFAGYAPVESERAVNYLGNVLGDSRESPKMRASAATALHLAGGSYAAQAIATQVSPSDEAMAFDEGTVITAVGFLANDLWAENEALHVLRPVAWNNGSPFASLNGQLVDYLEGASKRTSGSLLAGVCTALDEARHQRAGDIIVNALKRSSEAGDVIALGPCISAAGDTRARSSRDLLAQIVGGSDPRLPRQFGGAAIRSLNMIGFDDATWFVQLFRRTAAHAAHLGMYIEDVSDRGVSQRLLECATDTLAASADRRRCLYGLLLLDDDEDGDDFVVSVGMLVEDEQLLDVACMVVRESLLRGGIAARFTMENTIEACEEAHLFKATSDLERLPNRKRWDKYVDLLEQEAASLSTGPGSVGDRL